VQLFSGHAEPRSDCLEESVHVGHFYRWVGVRFYAQDDRIHFGLGMEAPGGYVVDDVGLAVELNADGQQAHVTRLGDDGFPHLFLHHNHHQMRFKWVLEKMAQCGRGDVIRQVGYHLVLWCIRLLLVITEELANIGFQDVSGDYADIGCGAKGFIQSTNQIDIHLDGDNTGGPFGQLPGQNTQPWTNLDDGITGGEFRCRNYALYYSPVTQEMLSQAFPGADAETPRSLAFTTGIMG